MADVKTEVVRDLSAIKTEITSIKQEVKGTKNEIKDLDKALKVDPTNIELINKKFDKQKYVIEQLNKEVNAYVEKQQAWKKQLEEGSINVDKYNKKIKDEQIEIDKLTRQIDSLNSEYNEQNRILAVNQAAYKNNITSVDNFQKSLDKASKVILVMVAAISALSYTTIELGAELNDIAKKYGTTAEELQKQRNIYKQLTNDEKTYENALKSLSNVIRSLNRGAGETNAFKKALSDLGIEADKVAEMQSGEAFSLIFEALQKVTDASKRANIAMILFGDNGLTISNVAGESAEKINELNKQFESAGIISNYSAEQLKQLQSSLGYTKTAFQTLLAEVLVEIAPIILGFLNALKNLANFLKSGLGKTLLWVVGIFSTFILTLNIAAKAYKSLQIFMLAYNTMQKVSGTTTVWATLKQMLFNASLTKTVVLMAAITGGATLLVGAIAGIGAAAANSSSNVEDLTSEYEQLKESIDSLGANTNISTTSVSQTNSNKKVDMNINLHAHGDTPISNESANIVAIAIDEQLQKSWGNLI